MATIFALSLVPAGAFASEVKPDWGDMENGSTGEGTPGYNANLKRNQGTITIAGTKMNETYDVYRIFDLASFADDDTTAGVHVETNEDGKITTNEAYSYVISETMPNPSFDENEDEDPTTNPKRIANPWWTWLHTAATGGKYAATVPAAGKNADDDTAYWRDHADQLFWIEPEKVTVNGVSDYHVVTATKNFPSSWDVTDLQNDAVDNGQDAFDYEKQDYVDPTSTGTNNASKSTIKVVQDFAQTALAWARTETGTPAKPNAAPNFSETGTGLDVTVDGTSNKPAGTGADHNGDGKVPLGWYLMGTTTGTLASLDTANRAVTVYEKNQVPELEKKVLKKGSKAGGISADDLVKGTKEALEKKANDLEAEYNRLRDAFTVSAPGVTEDQVNEAKDAWDKAKAEKPVWVDDTDADFGDYVQFRSVITAQQGAKGYRLHDTMEKGLEFVNATIDQSDENTVADRYTKDADGNAYDSGDYALKVYHVSSKDAVTPIPNSVDGKTNWVLWTPGNTNENLRTTDGCDFEIEFRDSVGDTDSDRKVTFTYNAGTTDEPNYTTVELKDGDRIVVTYWAKLTDDAVVFGDEDGVESK